MSRFPKTDNLLLEKYGREELFQVLEVGHNLEETRAEPMFAVLCLHMAQVDETFVSQYLAESSYLRLA